jgi:ATP-dependent Lhr-like helicase
VAQQLLDRDGVVTRDAVLAEGIPGGFSGLAPVFAAMEDAGKVRRGYFIEGRGGTQFGLPGAIDRLREPRPAGTVVLASTDPANPYGASLPWPTVAGGTPARRSGAFVALTEGRLAAYVERGAHRVVTGEDADPDAVAAALVTLAGRRSRRTTIATVDGVPVTDSPLAGPLRAAGFDVGYRGLTYRPQRRGGAG